MDSFRGHCEGEPLASCTCVDQGVKRCWHSSPTSPAEVVETVAQDLTRTQARPSQKAGMARQADSKVSVKDLGWPSAQLISTSCSNRSQFEPQR